MPLPVSSQVYIHNPLTEARAAQIGKDVGSPLGNFLGGLTSGFSQGVDIAQGLQQLELAPEEQERKNSATRIDQQRLQLDQQRESRLDQNQEFEQDYKTQELDIREKEMIIRRDRADSQIRNKDAATSLAMQKQARSNITDEAVNQIAARGNPDPLLAILQDPDLRNLSSLTEKLAKDPAKGQSVVDGISDAKINGRIPVEMMPAVDRFLSNLDHAKNINVADREAERMIPVWSSHLHAVPDIDSKVKMEIIKNGDSSDFKWTEILKDGREKPLGKLPGYADPKIIEKLYQAQNAKNRQAEERKALRDAVARSSREKAARRETAGQQELPTKISKESATTIAATPTTTATKLGLNNTVPSDKEETIDRNKNPKIDKAKQRQAAMRLQESRKRQNEKMIGKAQRSALSGNPVTAPFAPLFLQR